MARGHGRRESGLQWSLPRPSSPWRCDLDLRRLRGLAFPLLSLAAGCASAPPDWRTPEGKDALRERHRDEEFVAVAACSGNDRMTMGHAGNLLLSAGIPSASMGSVGKDLLVPRSLAARAEEVLVANQREDVYSCRKETIPPDPGPVLFLAWNRPRQGVVTEYGRPVAAVLAEEPEGSLLAAALRESRARERAERLPILDRVERWDRPHLAGDGAWRTGAFLRITLVSPPGAPEGEQGRFRLDYTVWPDEGGGGGGARAMSQGGLGGGPASVR